ncbi:MAG: DNA primase [Defluviitaleaceae bacterium]|nr:DNA primase [Defluviitaleaceae bacterium]MCL2238878.1 DNA primase [Defluviitaleaceae bacterium]
MFNTFSFTLALKDFRQTRRIYKDIPKIKERAMFYPDEIIQEVRAQNDIVDVVGSYVALRVRGGRHWGLCPFHQEKTPSFTVNTDTQFFHCFGCGAGGNVFTFVMRFEHMDFVDALKLLADRVHFILPQPGSAPSEGRKHKERAQHAEYNKVAARFFYENLRSDAPEAVQAREYLQNRGVTDKLQALFGLGLSPPGWDALLRHMTAPGDISPADLHTAGLLAKGQNEREHYYDRFRGRLMFPIIDTGKRVVGFGGRIMRESDKEAKYLNSPETSLFNKSSQLYALHLARRTRAKELIVVEGYMDVLALFKAGFSNAVGVLGTALTARHVQLLRRAGCETALLLLDSDEAGTAAAQRSIPILLQGGLRVKVLQTPDAKDPDEFLQKFGPQRLGQLLAGARSHIAFQIKLLLQQFDMDKPDDRIQFAQEAKQCIAHLESKIEMKAYADEIGQISGIAPEVIFNDAKEQQEKTAKTEEGFFPAGAPRARTRSSKEDPGLREARKALLHLALTHRAAATALGGYLAPEEMGDGVYARLLAFAYENTSAPADVVSRFETAEAQQQAAEVFSKPIAYASVPEMEKSLNEMASIIKIAYINSQIEQLGGKNDLNAVKSLALRKKSLQNQYITLSNG